MSLHGSFNELSDDLSFSDWSYPSHWNPMASFRCPCGRVKPMRGADYMLQYRHDHLATCHGAHWHLCCLPCVCTPPITWDLVVRSAIPERVTYSTCNDMHKCRVHAVFSPRADLPHKSSSDMSLPRPGHSRLNKVNKDAIMRRTTRFMPPSVPSDLQARTLTLRMTNRKRAVASLIRT